jgi:PAS domain S-box-containing protein
VDNPFNQYELNQNKLNQTEPNRNELSAEMEALRTRLEEAEETLRAIRDGEVDAVVVSGPSGAQIFTLESAEQPYRVLIEQMQEGAVTLSEEGLILYCNLRFAEMLRTPHERVIALPAHTHVAPEYAQRFASLLQAGASRSARAEITLRAADGTILPAFITISPLPIEVEGCLCMVVTDLTEQESLRRNQAEINELNERLKRSMTETHHRVKNNLQIIAAMIDMQVLEGEQTLPVTEFVRLSRQVRTLAMVHDLLTTQAKADKEAHSISASELLTKLFPLLQTTSGGRRIRVQLAEAQISARQGTSLALITNELISNALKHGIGDVEVTFQVHENSAILEVCDDGPGFPPGFDVAKTETTGLGLVANLSRWDLGGYVQFQNRPQGGAKVAIHIPIETIRP